MRSFKRRRFDNAINAGSMADIAFLLLIFFLVTTTILEEQGIFVKLPPWDPNHELVNLNDENVLTVKVNSINQLMVEGQISDFSLLRSEVKTFIKNPTRRPDQAVVSLQNDRGTEYKTYLLTYNEIKAAYTELWEEAALKRYGKSYTTLQTAFQKAIRNEIPLVISEAEPTSIGEKPAGPE